MLSIQQLPTRVIWVIGATFVFILFLGFHSYGSTPDLSQLAGGRTGFAATGAPKEGGITNNIFNSTLGFEKIFVIGLPTRTDRRDGMVLQAALSGLEIEFIDGIMGKDVPDKAIPISPDHGRLNNATIGSWRAHMNAVQEIVHRNLSSALILEDDTDWDIRIKQQLFDFALSSHALTQPLASKDPKRPGRHYADPTYKKGPHPKQLKPIPDQSRDHIPELDFHQLPPTIPPTNDPYGDEWDLMWLGHCGMSFAHDTEGKDVLPKGRVIRLDDETVVPKHNQWSLNKPFALVKDYPEHTRVIHHGQEGLCSLGYALSQRGAQKFLYEVGLKDVSDGFDFLLRWYCDSGKAGRKSHNCLAVQPAYFQHHRPVGSIAASSDIGNHKDGYRETARTDMIRWSVRLNAEALMDGRTDFVDQFPDKKAEEEKAEKKG